LAGIQGAAPLGRVRVKPVCSPTPKRGVESWRLPLAHFHPRVLLVDDVNPPAAAHHAAVLVAHFGRPQAVPNSHDTRLPVEIEGAVDTGGRRPCQAEPLPRLWPPRPWSRGRRQLPCLTPGHVRRHATSPAAAARREKGAAGRSTIPPPAPEPRTTRRRSPPPPSLAPGGASRRLPAAYGAG